MEFKKDKPVVSIIMGSKSDAETMKQAAEVLDVFGVPWEMKVVSAHRSPKYAYDFASRVPSRGIEVVIAGAGGAAHLAGVMAALTTIPVIGVPIESKSLKGLDSLLSTVQMPGGVPVATVAIGGAKNAGFLAVRMLSLKYPQLAEKLKAHGASMEEEIRSLKL